MSSVSVRFNSFSFLYSIFNEQQVLPATASRFFAFFTIGVSPQGFESQSARIGCRHCRLVGLDGFEPSTSRLSGARSNHLSYRPFLMWLRFVHRTLYPSSDPFLSNPTLGCRLSSAGGDDGNRTHDPLLAGQVLSQLSYTPL